ncbi:hypothetical protein, partial [Desulfosporosinus sp. I2]|uniref:hypothetical protein n=1 Tax=Desulfosporosinus sp. I2 TaxID=1617025 RepID=UPI001FA70A71
TEAKAPITGTPSRFFIFHCLGKNPLPPENFELLDLAVFHDVKRDWSQYYPLNFQLGPLKIRTLPHPTVY